MSSLIDICDSVAKSKGILHKAAIRTLRDYIKATPEEELTRVIISMNKPEHLRALWEAGLSIGLQHAVINRLETLTREQH